MVILTKLYKDIPFLSLSGQFWLRVKEYIKILLIFFKKIRTKSFEACFGQKFKIIKKCWHPKNLKTFEAQLIFTGCYKKECMFKIHISQHFCS